MRYCPEIIRQLRQGVAHLVKEPGEDDYIVVDGAMLDTREYEDFVVPVWELEAARDAGKDAEAVTDSLGQAAVTNNRAATAIFPRLPADGRSHAPRPS